MTVPALYLLFFLSGATALVYQVVWARSLSLVFGGSHLAVTAVLSIFMAGLALGAYAIGRRVDRIERPLRLYGLLELGIALSAVVFAGLMQAYPAVYAVLAQGRDDSPLYLTTIRLLFSVVALIVPTALMGATLPVVSRFVSRQPDELRRHLSFLYGINTLGAVAGALLASFVLLRWYGVRVTFIAAIATNLLIGLAALALQRSVQTSHAPDSETPVAAVPGPADARMARLVLWGIGLSGFCAMGYEVLWTRVLTMAVGASVYSFTIMLAAFLTGIALGSQIHGVLARFSTTAAAGIGRLLAGFGLTQVAIGVTALLVTVFLRDIPVNAIRLQSYFAGAGAVSFESRVWAGFSLAFLYMIVPALFMGAAFPLAGEALARQRRATGQAVGEVLAANTLGAILGAAASGLVLIQVFGIERSLLLLATLNVGVGLVMFAGRRASKWPGAVVAAATLGVIGFLAIRPDMLQIWDRKYFAIFRSNQPEAFRTPEMVREALENTDVLYYAEGREATVSVIKIKGGEQAFITNGRVEASSHAQAQQVQYTLGHLPMLLCPDPKDVLVVGMGSGMTAGATAVHPGVESVTLVEIEPKVVGVARTFDAFNHGVTEHPKVKVLFNDGRNFLTTTNRMFDVITADPIHPWFRGAGSLYASEYFALAARHLRPGGVIAQWLPIYELTTADLASVVKTFQQHLPHTMLWLTHYDAVIVGSNAPFAMDESDLERRMADEQVGGDLTKVTMGSATDLLSYFVMGTEGMKRFAEGGTLNTDDLPYLEYSAPFSIARSSVMAANVEALAAQREPILPYLKAPADPAARDAQMNRWNGHLAAGKMGDRALALYLGQGAADPNFMVALRKVNMEYPAYAPGRALWAEFQTAQTLEPKLIERETFHVIGDGGTPTFIEVAAVLVPVGPTRASLMFVDNRSRTIYGQVYLDDYARGDRAKRLAADVMTAVRAAYNTIAAEARNQPAGLPASDIATQRIIAVISEKVRDVPPGT